MVHGTSEFDRHQLPPSGPVAPLASSAVPINPKLSLKRELGPVTWSHSEAHPFFFCGCSFFCRLRVTRLFWIQSPARSRAFTPGRAAAVDQTNTIASLPGRNRLPSFRASLLQRSVPCFAVDLQDHVPPRRESSICPPGCPPGVPILLYPPPSRPKGNWQFGPRAERHVRGVSKHHRPQRAFAVGFRRRSERFLRDSC